MISALLVLVTSIAYSASNLKQVEGTAFNLKQDYSIAVKDGRRLLTGVCSNGANRLDESPNGNIVVCQDASQSTCEEDFAVLCPTGFSLCDQSTFFANNIGWTGSASTNYLGEIRCRDGSGAGHDGIYSGQSLASPNWANRVWGSSLAECTAWYGCNEKGFAALCCGVGTVRIYEHFALGTCRDKDSAAHAFNLAHLEKALPQEDCEEECDSFDGCLGYSLGNTATSCLLHFADGDFPEQEGEDAGWSTRNSEVGAVEINDVWTAYTHYDCYILSDGSDTDTPTAAPTNTDIPTAAPTNMLIDIVREVKWICKNDRTEQGWNNAKEPVNRLQGRCDTPRWKESEQRARIVLKKEWSGSETDNTRRERLKQRVNWYKLCMHTKHLQKQANRALACKNE